MLAAGQYKGRVGSRAYNTLGGNMGMGNYTRWSHLGPGGDPMMSLQGLGNYTHWGPLGPGGDPMMSLQGLGQAEATSAIRTSFEAEAKATLPAWQMMAAGAVGFGLGFITSQYMR